MKKFYRAPELEVVRLTLSDAILNSRLEETIPEVIGGEEGDLDLDGGL